MEQLTKEELSIIIECVEQTTVKVKDAPILITIIKKLSKMIDAITAQPSDKTST